MWVKERWAKWREWRTRVPNTYPITHGRCHHGGRHSGGRRGGGGGWRGGDGRRYRGGAVVGVVVVVDLVAGVVVVMHAYAGSMGWKVVMWYCVLVRGSRAGGGWCLPGSQWGWVVAGGVVMWQFLLACHCLPYPLVNFGVS